MNKKRNTRVGNQSNATVKKLVKTFLKQQKAGATKHQIVTATGLSVYDVEDALEDFIGIYQCVLKADEAYNLTYLFDFSDVVGKRKPWEIVKTLGKKAFIGFFTLMLFYNALLYFPYLVWVGPQLFLVLAVGSSPIFLLIFIYAFIEDTTQIFSKISFHKTIYRFFIGRRKYTFSIDNLNKNIFQMVFEFVFGEQEAENFLTEEKRVLAYITQNKNRITVTELILITGWSLDKAEKEITRFMYHYDGKVEVNTEGVLIYHFPSLVAQSSYVSDKLEELFIWNNLKPIKDWNKNYTFVNGLIALINSFVLVSSTILIISAENGNIPFLPISFNIHYLPFVFSISFFALFVYGKRKHLINNRQKLANNRFYLYLKQIMSTPEKVVFDDKNPFQEVVATDFDAVYQNQQDGSIQIKLKKVIEDLTATETLALIKLEAISMPDINKTQPKKAYKQIRHRIFKQELKDKKVYVFRKKADMYTMVYVTVYSILSIASLSVIIWAPIGLSILLLPVFSFFMYSVLKHFSNFTESVRLELSPKTCIVKSGPISIFGPNVTCSLDQIETSICKMDSDYLHQLLLSTENTKFYIPLIRKHPARTLLWEIAIEIMEWKEEMINKK